MGWRTTSSICFGVLTWLVACGARSGLEVDDAVGDGGMGGGSGGAGGVVEPPCPDGATQPCGSDVGTCELGSQTCAAGTWGECTGGIIAVAELCNGLDENCDGQVDEPWGVGQACDGPDSDACEDDVMSCEGCSAGPNNVELCNGVDDNCNGVTDADCEVGDCQPTLVVTGSTPSSPSCVDFPVTAGSDGTIQFPCGGGVVTATLGEVDFTGSVEQGVVSLDGIAVVIGPDGCTWQTSHHISGQLYSGVLQYTYSEEVISIDIGQCWQPCTEVGQVTIDWTVAP